MVYRNTRCGKAALAGAIFVAAVGFGVLMGWFLDWDRVKRPIPGLAEMNPATAFGFLLTGVSLALLLRPFSAVSSRAPRLLARALAGLVAVLGLARLIGTLGGRDFGVDLNLFASQGPALQVRMAPNTALDLLLFGSALCWADAKANAARVGAQLAVCLVGVGALIAISGYIYGAQTLYGLRGFSPMALPTAITFLVLVGAFLLSQSDHGLMAVLTGRSAGGAMARRLLPAAILSPIALGWLTLHGTLDGIFPEAVGNAWDDIGNVCVFTALICWCARGLHQLDRQRERAETAKRESEVLFSGAFEHAPGGVALLSPEGRWLKVNHSFCDIIGYSEAQLLLRTFQDVTHPDDIASCEDSLRSLIAGDIACYRAEKRYIHLAGHAVAVFFSVSLVRDDQGQPLYLIAQIADITKRKETEKSIRLNERRYRSLVEATTAIVWNASPTGQFEGDQPGWTAFTGQSYEELRGVGWLNAIHPDDRADTLRRWSQAVSHGKNLVREAEGLVHRLRARDQTYRYMMVRAVPILDDDETICQWIGTHTDVTERKLAEEELRWKTALMEAQINASVDAITVIDGNRQKILENPRAIELFRVPESLAGQPKYRNQLQWVAELTRNPADFLANARHLDEHPEEVCRDEIEFKDGTVLDRYTGPVVGKDGKYYGRLVTMRDITDRRKAEIESRQKSSLIRIAGRVTRLGGWALSLPDQQLTWSDEMYELLDFPRNSSLSVPEILELFPEPWREQFVDGIANCAEQGTPFDLELECLTRAGKRLWVRVCVEAERLVDGSITRLHGAFQDITERRHAEDLLRLLGSTVEQVEESIVITDAQLDESGPRIVFVNPAHAAMTGYAAAEVIGQTPRMMEGPHTDAEVMQRLRDSLAQGENFAGETINYRKDGSEFTVEWHVTPIRNGAGKITHYVAIQRDITERKNLEIRLIQSQKMETVGKLAGGIAHEFNSILTAIIGQSELLLDELTANSPLTKNVTEISTAATRAATLTRQLLAYGRKQMLQPESLNLNRVISSMEGVLAHLMGSEINIRVAPAKNLRPVKADAGQVEQVIMNIAMNARDAMPNGGKLTLETANVSIDQESATNYPELKPGNYVMLAITDTGGGMTDEAKARVFEPFFSTKEVGKGTGLGLSTCYGIVKQSGGHITVYSELARGAVFKIYLPCVDAPVKTISPTPASPGLPRGNETILLVEDDPALREMAASLLERLGYTVLAAAHGIEALTLRQQHGIGQVDLLLTDVVMPHMSGNELADRVRSLYPRTRILFTSAYTENAITHQGVLKEGVAMLQKPFTPSALAKKLREILGQPILLDTERGPLDVVARSPIDNAKRKV